MAKLRTSSAISYKKQAATRCGMANRSTTPSGSSNYAEHQCWYNIKFPYATNNIEVAWSNFMLSTNYNGLNTGRKAEIVPSDVVMTVRAGIEISGVTYPLYAPDGSRDLVIQSDEVKSFANLAQPIPAGTICVLKYKITYSAIPLRWLSFEAHQNVIAKNEFGSGLTDRTLDASWGSPANTSGFVICPPAYVIGDISGKSIEILGDSIGSNGQSDSGWVGDLGFIMKACTANGVPYINNGRQSMPMWYYVSSDAEIIPSQNRRRAIVPPRSVDFMLVQMITNDLGWTRDDASCIAALSALKTKMDALNIKIIPMTCPPRTNSSNNAKFGTDSPSVWGWRRSYNQYLRDNNGVGYGYFDVAAVLSSSAGGATPDINGDYWISGYKSDGIHPNDFGHAAMNTALQSYLPRLLQTWKAR